MTQKKTNATPGGVAAAEAKAAASLAAYMTAFHSQLISETGDAALALQGDPAAIRGLLETFREYWRSRRIRVVDLPAHINVTGVDRLLRRILEQAAEDDSALRKALGFAQSRRRREDFLLDELIHRAMDHAMFGMGTVRTEEAAGALVERASGAMPAVFRQAVEAGKAERVYRRLRGPIEKMGPLPESEPPVKEG
jgi:hypothetical protein